MERRPFRTLMAREDPDTVPAAEDVLRHQVFDGGLLTFVLSIPVVSGVEFRSRFSCLPSIGTWLLKAVRMVRGAQARPSGGRCAIRTTPVYTTTGWADRDGPEMPV